MGKIVNISEDKFRKALRSIVEMDFGKEEMEDEVPSEQDSTDDPFNSQRSKIPNPNKRPAGNHEESTVGENGYETLDERLPGAADFKI